MEERSSSEPYEPLSHVAVLMSGFFVGGPFYGEELAKRGVGVAESLRPIQSRIGRGIRRLHMRSWMPGKWVWFGNWEPVIESRDLVIVHAADVLVPVAEYIARRYPRKRVILWYWNNASPGSNPALARSQRRIELWSFDSEDCARYGMGHNTTYSFMSLSDIDATSDVDFFFFGADKGRAAILDELAGAITRAGLTHRLWIAGDESRGVSPSGVAFRSPMSYSAHLTNTARARVIVDVVQAGQSGMTLRPLEALFLGKKLLTNSLDIVHSPLYDPTRVFVFGLDDEAALRSFVETPMVRPTRALLEYYDVAGWIGRFENRMPH